MQTTGGGVKIDFTFYYGKRFGTKKDIFLKQADIFIFPTYYHNECFPLVLLEAMQQSVACISTDEGGIPGIIENGETGYIVKKHSAEAIAEKVEHLLKHPELCTAMGKAGREKFLKEFTLERFEKRMKGILEEEIIE